MARKWREYENYMVSSDGQIRGPNGDILKPAKSSSGRLRVQLYKKNGQRYTVAVGILVLRCFGNPPPWGAWVAYKNGNIEDNAIENLYWENTYKRKTEKTKKKGRKTKPRLSTVQPKIKTFYLDEIKSVLPELKTEILNSPLYPHELAEKYNLSVDLICKVKFRSRWKIAMRVMGYLK